MTGDMAVALHALVFLQHRRETLSSDMLAWNICTNPARVRKVMAKLRRAGLVAAREGKIEGGYTSLPDAGSIRLIDVLDALGERCVECTWKPGSDELGCLVSAQMANAADALYAELDACCRKRLAELTVEDIARAVFEGRAESEEMPFAGKNNF